jgi:hypothetical protein
MKLFPLGHAAAVAALSILLAEAAPAWAVPQANVFICAALNCGDGFTSPDNEVTFYLKNFTSFEIDGTKYANPATVSVSEIGSFVDGAAQITFEGTWAVANETGVSPRTPGLPNDQTVFFRNQGVPTTGKVSDVFFFDETYVDSKTAEVDGYVISVPDAGAIPSTDLATLGIVATQNRPLTDTPYAFGGNALKAAAQFQSIPEPSTWVMMLIGACGLGYAGFCSARRGAVSA